MKTTSMTKSKYWTVRLFSIAQTCLVLNLLFPSTVFAYVDPGSGSVIVTTVLGLIAAIGYTLRKYFYRIKRIIIGKKVPEEQQDDE